MSLLQVIALMPGLMMTTPAAPPDSVAAVANVFVLKQTKSGLDIESVPLEIDQTKVFITGPGSDVIDVIFPPSLGRSAGLAMPDDRRTLVVSYKDGELRLESRSPDGSESQKRPARRVAEISQYDIRVNVTGKGRRTAFLIAQNANVAPEIGPVANMFAGRVPDAVLNSGYVIQTETYLHESGTPILGAAPLEIDRWPFARVTLPGGTSGDFIVDVGAAGTVVARDFLPTDAEIEKASMVEYSAAGKRTLKYTPGGATGAVQTVLGHAALEGLRIGNVEIDDLTVTVLEQMPDMFGRPVAGIIGLDVLRRCNVLTMQLGDQTEPTMQWGQHSTAAAQNVLELPFARVSAHLVVEGECNGETVYFILDTGSPGVFLDNAAARALAVQGDVTKAIDARGLDEGAVKTLPGTISELRFGERTFTDVPCNIGGLFAFDTLRADDQNIALLGNSFFGRFNRVEFDFGKRVIRLID